jgi:hypothetical protein
MSIGMSDCRLFDKRLKRIGISLLILEGLAGFGFYSAGGGRRSVTSLKKLKRIGKIPQEVEEDR